MSETETKLLAYVGRGLGKRPVTDFRDGVHRLVWDRPHAVPVHLAAGLMKKNPGQFAVVEQPAEQAPVKEEKKKPAAKAKGKGE